VQRAHAEVVEKGGVRPLVRPPGALLGVLGQGLGDDQLQGLQWSEYGGRMGGEWGPSLCVPSD